MDDTNAWRLNKLYELQNLQNLISNIDFGQIESLGKLVVDALKKNKKIAFLGNGGSAAEAMHLAAEFVSKCSKDHRPLNAVCLNESQSAITAIANDFGFEYIFERIVEAELNRGDILIALSTSGKSSNVINSINKAIQIGVKVFLWTGKNRIDINFVEIWNCELESTPRIQELHLIWGHLLAEYVELYFD
jgi:D-sedoheptulose 7-phosphate isomerase